jgi:hypothetical protein
MLDPLALFHSFSLSQPGADEISRRAHAALCEQRPVGESYFEAVVDAFVRSLVSCPSWRLNNSKNSPRYFITCEELRVK